MISVAETPLFKVMVTTRGDCSGDEASAYRAFNPCHYTGDDPRHVACSRAMLVNAIGIPESSLVIPRQVHSATVRVIGEVPVDQSSVDGADALVTRLRRVAIGVSTADCVPVAIVDVNAGVIGVAHAGWRGAIGGIVGNTVRTMIELGASAAGMQAFFGPAICRDCFEVGEEVAARFPADCVVRSVQWLKPHVDLPAYVRRCLLEAGLQDGKIGGFDSEICTRCHPDRYFSARAAGVKSGRNFTFIMLE